MNSMQLKCFIEAARCRNLSDAAVRLFISQPTISRNISTLEDEWQLQLFKRGKGKDLTLTAAGEYMYQGLLPLLQQYEHLLEHASKVEHGMAGFLHIGLLDGERIDDRTLKALSIFQEKFPNVDTSLRRGSYREVLHWLKEGLIDCVITLKIEVQNKPWVEYQGLFNAHTKLFIHKSNPLSRLTSAAMIDFKNETFLSVESRESPILNALLIRECNKNGFMPKVVSAPDVKTQLLMLEANKGLIIGSTNNMFIDHKNIAAISLPELMSLTFVLAWKKDTKNPCIPQFLAEFKQ